MQAFHIHYRNTQGTLLRILTAASRRGIDIPHVHAGPSEQAYSVTLTLDLTPKQIGQLCRDWHAIVDVTDVRAASPPAGKTTGERPAPHPPASAGMVEHQGARTAIAY